jgi:hypothetical protein
MPARQRERIEHRPRLPVKLIKPAQHRLAMRNRRSRKRTAARRRHIRRVRLCFPGIAGGTGRVTPMRPFYLASELNPPGEVPGLDASRLIPWDLDRRQEPEPPQQVHRIRPQRRLRPPRRLKILQIRRHRLNRHTLSIDQPVRLPQVTGLLQPPNPRDGQPRQVRSASS